MRAAFRRLGASSFQPLMSLVGWRRAAARRAAGSTVALPLSLASAICLEVLYFTTKRARCCFTAGSIRRSSGEGKSPSATVNTTSGTMAPSSRPVMSLSPSFFSCFTGPKKIRWNITSR